MRNNFDKGDGEMEKITKEELINKLGGEALSDEELENVAGGFNYYEYCHHLYDTSQAQKLYDCLEYYSTK